MTFSGKLCERNDMLHDVGLFGTTLIVDIMGNSCNLPFVIVRQRHQQQVLAYNSNILSTGRQSYYSDG